MKENEVAATIVSLHLLFTVLKKEENNFLNYNISERLKIT